MREGALDKEQRKQTSKFLLNDILEGKGKGMGELVEG